MSVHGIRSCAAIFVNDFFTVSIINESAHKTFWSRLPLLNMVHQGYTFLICEWYFILSEHAEGYETLENKLRMIVDVRDVAEALLITYEKPEAEGRYICTAHMIKVRDLVEKLRSMYPNYNYPKK